MPVGAAMRLDLQSAMCETQNRFRRAELELRGPRNDLEIDPRSSRGVRSVPSFVEIPNLPT
eukprot:15483559-Alexandrium_andersonii.AAC.1